MPSRTDRCKNGHPWTSETTRVWGGRRSCLACSEERLKSQPTCPKGHPWTTESTYLYTRNGKEHRYCRICRKKNRATAVHVPTDALTEKQRRRLREAREDGVTMVDLVSRFGPHARRVLEEMEAA